MELLDFMQSEQRAFDGMLICLDIRSLVGGLQHILPVLQHPSNFTSTLPTLHMSELIHLSCKNF
jgi:hypothetical protein